MPDVSQMLHFAHNLAATQTGRGALAGLAAAAWADVVAFRAWKSWNDAATYQWGTASFRWAQGFVLGAMSSLGLDVVL